MLRLEQIVFGLVSLVLIAACSQGALAAVEKQTVYRYVSYSYGAEGHAEIKLDLGNREIIYPHTFSELMTCGSDSKEYCFTSAPLSFCVPKSKEIPDSWQCSGNSYKRTGNLTIQILGISIPVTVIRSKDVYFYFSAENGLVAIKFTGNAALSEFYISSELNGFASSKGTK